MASLKVVVSRRRRFFSSRLEEWEGATRNTSPILRERPTGTSEVKFIVSSIYQRPQGIQHVVRFFTSSQAIDIRRCFRNGCLRMKGLKQVGWPVLQIGELPPTPPPKKKKKSKQTTDALFTSQAHGDQNPKDPNDKKQEDANPEECFQRFCHCSNDNPKFSKFLWSDSNDFQRIVLVQLKEEIWWFCFFS